MKIEGGNVTVPGTAQASHLIYGLLSTKKIVVAPWAKMGAWKGLEMTRKTWAVFNLVRLYVGLFSRPITGHDSPERRRLW